MVSGSNLLDYFRTNTNTARSFNHASTMRCQPTGTIITANIIRREMKP